MSDPEFAQSQTTPRPSILASWSLRLALLITLIGAGAWGYALATRPALTPSPAAVSSLTDAPAPPLQTRLIDSAGPATARFGLSFIGAFFVAYVLKKVLRSVLLVAGLIVAGIVALKYMGIITLDWAGAQHQVEHGVDLVRQEGEKARSFLMGLLPSTVSAGAGAVVGAKKA